MPSVAYLNKPAAKHGRLVLVIDGDALAFEVVVPFLKGFKKLVRNPTEQSQLPADHQFRKNCLLSALRPKYQL